MMPVPVMSAAVTGVPSKNVKARDVPFKVRCTGNVPVVPSGMASYIRTVK